MALLYPKAAVRALAIAVIRRRSEILLMAVRDARRELLGWRPLGGEIEFGERAEDAVAREFIEELGRPICDLRHLCVLENLFSYNGRPGHEVVFVFEARFADAAAYDEPGFAFADGDVSLDAAWVDQRDLSDARAPLFPAGLLERLASR